jgi:hypothetical protein
MLEIPLPEGAYVFWRRFVDVLHTFTARHRHGWDGWKPIHDNAYRLSATAHNPASCTEPMVSGALHCDVGGLLGFGDGYRSRGTLDVSSG